MDETTYSIYQLFCIPSGKSYIGFTKHSIRSRLMYHKSRVKTGSKFALHCAMRKYGMDNFKSEILFQTNSREEALEKEKFFIVKHRSRCEENGYNMTEGGEAMQGYIWPEEVKQRIYPKLSKIFSGEGNPNFGKKTSDHVKESIREWRKNNPEKAALLNPSNNCKAASMKAHCKDWLVIYPCGKEEIITNLKRFCEKNGLSKASMLRISKNFPQRCKEFACKPL